MMLERHLDFSETLKVILDELRRVTAAPVGKKPRRP
jgi:hypothetical protein